MVCCRLGFFVYTAQKWNSLGSRRDERLKFSTRRGNS